MFRNLRAIEIAEGALLADVAVIFQFIAVFLPVGSSFFHILTIVAFSVLVLRRGLYVGLMGTCVAVFIISIIVGPSYIISMITECMAGSFLGITMKLRFHHLPLLLLAIVSGALFVYASVFFFTWILGLSLNDIVQMLHRGYNTTLPLVGLVLTKVGLGVQWRQFIRPQIMLLSTYAFTYWWLTLYIALFLSLAPVVTLVYLVTNSFVRLLGYDVRPFPGGHLNMFMYRTSRRLLKLSLKWGVVRKPWIKA
jgi:hypothetical protein